MSAGERRVGVVLAQRIYDWMRSLKVNGDFLPAEVVCDHAGMHNFINAMAKVIGEDAHATLLSEREALRAALENLVGATDDTLRSHSETACCHVTRSRCFEARQLLALIAEGERK